MPEDVINSKFYKSWLKHDLQNLKAAICVLIFLPNIQTNTFKYASIQI